MAGGAARAPSAAPEIQPPDAPAATAVPTAALIPAADSTDLFRRYLIIGAVGLGAGGNRDGCLARHANLVAMTSLLRLPAGRFAPTVVQSPS